MATKKANNVIIKNLDKAKATAGTLHDNALHATDTLVDNSLAIGKEWQKLFAKAMKHGVVLFGKQQEIVLESLETVKEQYIDGEKQLKKLVGLKKAVRPLKTPLLSKIEARRKAAKKAVKKATTKLTAQPKASKAPVAKAKKTAKKTAKKVAVVKTTTQKNDLKSIKGIGPKVEGLFNKAGIYTFEQIAKTDIKTLKSILATGGNRYKMINPADWKKQAKAAAKKVKK